MNLFKKFRPYKGQLVESYLETLANISKHTGVHNYKFDKTGIIYRPQKSLVDFFIKVLEEISRLGLTDMKMARKLNHSNVPNPLCAEIRPWTETDVSHVLSVPESGLLLIN